MRLLSVEALGQRRVMIGGIQCRRLGMPASESQRGSLPGMLCVMASPYGLPVRGTEQRLLLPSNRQQPPFAPSISIHS
jgi:hypothetical protein